MSVRRGTTNRNQRGSAQARRDRKLWLVTTFGWPDPVDPWRGLVLCWLCDVPLLATEVTADRYPVLGIDGGTYSRNNIRPACITCNASHGGRVGAARLKAKRARKAYALTA